MFPLEYIILTLSKAKRLCEAKKQKFVWSLPVPCNQIVVSVMVRIAAVEFSTPPPGNPPPSPRPQKIENGT